MAASGFSMCPGCGLKLPLTDAPADDRFNASAECWQLYGEVTGYTVGLGYENGEFIHQLLVDTYGAQHARDDGPAIGLAFALIGLYLTYERGSTGSQVQRMHMQLARRSKTWPRFTRPAQVGDMTVHNVVLASPGPERDATLRRWGQAVWAAWGHAHEQVRTLFEHVMST